MQLSRRRKSHFMITKSDLSIKELQYLHEVLLFQRMLDPKNRKKIDQIRQKILTEIEWQQMKEKLSDDEKDNLYRKKIVK